MALFPNSETQVPIRVFFSSILFVATLISAQPSKFKINTDPNNLANYLSIEGINRLEAEFADYSTKGKDDTKISTDLSLVQFYLWTPEVIILNNGQPWKFNATATPQELLDKGFDKTRETKFIGHGWNSGADFANGFKNGYYSHPDKQFHYNMISVHWTPLATWDNYFVAASNAVKVGQHSGQVIGLDLLINGIGQSPDQIHAIGHSLGAHLVGHFARTIKNGARAIKRTTGLDPAKPWFDLTDGSNSIGKDDAQFVDIVHTNSGFLLNGRLSILEPLGDIDFYPNGGQHQPGCTDACFGIICLEIDLWDFFNGACSHARSHEYYIESVFFQDKGVKFLSSSCNSWEDFEGGECHDHIEAMPMGENLDIENVKQNLKKGGESNFYLTTNEEAPFSTTSTISK